MRSAHFIGYSEEDLKRLIRSVVMECLLEFRFPQKEKELNIRDVCKLLKVSAPTLKKFVDQGIIRRHDLGGRKKVFYWSELQEDIKSIK